MIKKVDMKSLLTSKEGQRLLVGNMKDSGKGNGSYETVGHDNPAFYSEQGAKKGGVLPDVETPQIVPPQAQMIPKRSEVSRFKNFTVQKSRMESSGIFVEQPDAEATPISITIKQPDDAKESDPGAEDQLEYPTTNDNDEESSECSEIERVLNVTSSDDNYDSNESSNEERIAGDGTEKRISDIEPQLLEIPQVNIRYSSHPEIEYSSLGTSEQKSREERQKLLRRAETLDEAYSQDPIMEDLMRSQSFRTNKSHSTEEYMNIPGACDTPINSGGRSSYKRSGKDAEEVQLLSAANSLPSITSVDDSVFENEHQNVIHDKIRRLVKAFSDRGDRIKNRISQPVTPPPSPSPSPEKIMEETNDEEPTEEDIDVNAAASRQDVADRPKFRCKFPHTLDPQSRLYVSWLMVVTLAYLYNAWSVFLRAAFPYATPHAIGYFLFFDYFSDLIYIVDIVVFKVRVRFIQSGFWVENRQEIRAHYRKKFKFKMDVLSLLPLDLLYFWLGFKSLLRLPRLLKIQTFWEFFDRVDSIAKSPHSIRILRTVLNMLYLIHLNTCIYYTFSDWEGIGSNQWVFSGIGNAYVRCFYFATKTATSIGKNPKPVNEREYLYMTFSWLMGVFVFALLIGQVRDIVATANQAHREYQEKVDKTINYMQRLNIPNNLQAKVRLWFNHNWEQQKMLDERETLEVLPLKMKTDMALSVNFNTLNKVQLFKDCEKALLRDLVLKLKPVLYLPGDYVCRKGEVGKEMYIVNYGYIDVLGRDRKVLATLTEGSVFGEISLLAMGSGNRRTADVSSRGFSNLFVLSKNDLQEAIKDYPLAQKVLKKKAQNLIKQNEAREKTIKSDDDDISPIISARSRPKTPKMLKTVIEVMDKNSQSSTVLNLLKSRSAASALQEPNTPSSYRDSYLSVASLSTRSDRSYVSPDVLSAACIQSSSHSGDFSHGLTVPINPGMAISPDAMMRQRRKSQELVECSTDRTTTGAKSYLNSIISEIQERSSSRNNKVGPEKQQPRNDEKTTKRNSPIDDRTRNNNDPNVDDENDSQKTSKSDCSLKNRRISIFTLNKVAPLEDREQTRSDGK